MNTFSKLIASSLTVQRFIHHKNCTVNGTYSKLFFNFSVDQAATFDSKRVHIDNLFRMVQYCENVADCRRSQILNYFGERDFNREECGNFRGAICDNCVSKVCVHLFKYRSSQVTNQKAV